MGTIIDKLTYTKKAVDDIQAAIIEKGVECADSVPLDDYGNKTRDIKTHEKPTFCPWYDLGNVYYGFDENDIKYTTEFELVDEADIDIKEYIYT